MDPGQVIALAVVLDRQLPVALQFEEYRGVAAAVAHEAAVEDATAPDLKALNSPALASVAWVTMMYTFFGAQVSAKFDEADEKVTEIAMRVMMNTLEQAPCFFITMWLHALFVNPATAGALGFVYVAFRYAYGLFYGLYGQFTIIAEVSTVTNCETN